MFDTNDSSQILINRYQHDDQSVSLDISVKDLLEMGENETTVFSKVFKELKSDGLVDLKADHDRLLLALLGNPTPAEMHTWPRQLEQAQAIMSGSPTQSVLDAVSRRMIDGETHAEWAGKVLLVKSPFAKYCEELATGVRRRAESRLEALEYSDNWMAELQTANDAIAAEAEQAQASALQMLGQLKEAAEQAAAGAE